MITKDEKQNVEDYDIQKKDKIKSMEQYSSPEAGKEIPHLHGTKRLILYAQLSTTVHYSNTDEGTPYHHIQANLNFNLPFIPKPPLPFQYYLTQVPLFSSALPGIKVLYLPECKMTLT